MTTPSLSTPIVLAMLLLAIPACGDDSTAPGQEGPGMAFVYTGTLTGSFQAEGPASDAKDPAAPLLWRSGVPPGSYSCVPIKRSDKEEAISCW
jgi:hypothetical protein